MDSVLHWKTYTKLQPWAFRQLQNSALFQAPFQFPTPSINYIRNKAIQKLIKRNFSCEKCCKKLPNYSRWHVLMQLITWNFHSIRLSCNEFQKIIKRGGTGTLVWSLCKSSLKCVNVSRCFSKLKFKYRGGGGGGVGKSQNYSISEKNYSQYIAKFRFVSNSVHFFDAVLIFTLA